MSNNALVPFLVTMMLVTGVCNTILNKYQVSHTDRHHFSSPTLIHMYRTCNV